VQAGGGAVQQYNWNRIGLRAFITDVHLGVAVRSQPISYCIPAVLQGFYH
jgi:hypothetical protein